MRIVLRRLLRFVVAHPVALSVGTLLAVILFVANCCGWTRYSVEEDLSVCEYGIPFRYQVLARPEYTNIYGFPTQSTALLSFDTRALCWNVAIGLMFWGAAVVLFTSLQCLRIPRRYRLIFWLVTPALAFALSVGALSAGKAERDHRRSILREIETADGSVLIEYPVPDLCLTVIQHVGGWWFSERQVQECLDALFGKVTFLQGPPAVLQHVRELPALRAIDILDDLHALEFVHARILPDTSPSLERISVELGQIESLTGIIGLPRLRFLTIRGNLDVESLQALNKLKNLEGLDLTWCGMPEDDLVDFGGLTNLRILAPGTGTRTALRGIGKLPHLEELYLGGEVALTDQDIAELQGIRTLRRLDLGGCVRITDGAVKTVKQLSELQDLCLSGTAITDKGLRELTSLVKLENLDVSSTRVTNEGVSSLAALPHLRRLNLCRTLVDDRIGVVLQNLPKLESLNVGNMSITDQGVAHLRGLKALRRLDLSDTSITDRSVPYLLEMKRLEEVRLNMTGITTEGAAHLQCLPELHTLKVYDCPTIPASAIVELQRQTPRIDILEVFHSSLPPDLRSQEIPKGRESQSLQ